MSERGATGTRTFAQRHWVKSEQIEHDLFLLDTKLNKIHSLNGTAAIVWEMLAAPVSQSDLVADFAGAFPVVPQGKIRRDIAAILEKFVNLDIVLVSN
jgi:Coenzyme PQQ synthesis protein D (PqqD)